MRSKSMKYTQEQRQEIENLFTRVNSDSNGNPRFVIHFLDCELVADYSLDLSTRYTNACKLMNTIGGRKFHNKQFGGGIVFQSYNLTDTWTSIQRAIKEVKK